MNMFSRLSSFFKSEEATSEMLLNTTKPNVDEGDNLTTSQFRDNCFELRNLSISSNKDRRDDVISTFKNLREKWNVSKMLSGKGTSASNDSRRFTTIAYNQLSEHREEEGLVCLVIDKSVDKIEAMKPAFLDLFNAYVLLEKQQSACLESMSDFGNNQTRIVMYVQETSHAGVRRRLSALEFKTLLQNPNNKSTLHSLGVIDFTELVQLDQQMIDIYLAEPPPGIDPIAWEQAKKNNPDPSKFIPIQLEGLEGLKRRIDSQNVCLDHQLSILKELQNTMSDIENKSNFTQLRMEDFQMAQQIIAQRILKVMCSFQRAMELHYEIQSDKQNVFLQERITEILSQLELLRKSKLEDLSGALKSGSGDDAETCDANNGIGKEYLNLIQKQHNDLNNLVDKLRDHHKKVDDLKGSG